MNKKHIAKQTAFIGQQGRQPRREKGEDCLSGASSAAPERGVGVRANSPITAAALLGSFFSLQRRMNKKHIAKQTAFIGQRGRQPRREKGEDCLSRASSAAPERGVGVRANSPITAAALLGSFFSLQRRMNKKHIAKQTAFIGQQGRQPRREKGEDCLSGASSAAPERGVGVRAKSPITAAALLGSFFSLLRRMNKNMLHCIAKAVL